ncbi:putative but2-like protein [Lachnellula suecica]|uniref:Putative but2-like protein n=1 Tax=Lachnellula suecica TaxID=602035 RepID=A0A8T9C1F8_9HELO|nr:putative but2-like protein [Lachnellula suecica]
MKYSVSTLAFALGASAVSIPRDCTFTLSASGGQSGTVGQLSDGQNRVGGNNPTGTYTISNGQITDSQGRGCILTPPTTQFQCDVGATPTGGFAIGTQGQVTYNGSTTFYACPATDSMYNIYTTSVQGQAKCVEIELSASGCYASQTSSQQSKTTQQSCPAPSTVTVTSFVTQASQSSISSKASSSAPASTASSTTCPANLSGSYQYPHLIVPVSSTSPNTAAGTSYNGNIDSTTSSIFNFDIPSSYTGTCSLVFLFPEQSQLETSSYTFSGNGVLDFKQLSTVATQSTTYANQGTVKSDLGDFTVKPGTSTVVATFACPAGQAVSYEISSVSGTSLEYFQDYNPSPIGLYITSC